MAVPKRGPGGNDPPPNNNDAQKNEAIKRLTDLEKTFGNVDRLFGEMAASAKPSAKAFKRLERSLDALSESYSKAVYAAAKNPILQRRLGPAVGTKESTVLAAQARLDSKKAEEVANRNRAKQLQEAKRIALLDRDSAAKQQKSVSENDSAFWAAKGKHFEAHEARVAASVKRRTTSEEDNDRELWAAKASHLNRFQAQQAKEAKSDKRMADSREENEQAFWSDKDKYLKGFASKEAKIAKTRSATEDSNMKSLDTARNKALNDYSVRMSKNLNAMNNATAPAPGALWQADAKGFKFPKQIGPQSNWQKFLGFFGLGGGTDEETEDEGKGGRASSRLHGRGLTSRFAKMLGAPEGALVGIASAAVVYEVAKKLWTYSGEKAVETLAFREPIAGIGAMTGLSPLAMSGRMGGGDNFAPSNNLARLGFKDNAEVLATAQAYGATRGLAAGTVYAKALSQPGAKIGNVISKYGGFQGADKYAQQLGQLADAGLIRSDADAKRVAAQMAQGQTNVVNAGGNANQYQANYSTLAGAYFGMGAAPTPDYLNEKAQFGANSVIPGVRTGQASIALAQNMTGLADSLLSNSTANAAINQAFKREFGTTTPSLEDLQKYSKLHPEMHMGVENLTGSYAKEYDKNKAFGPQYALQAMLTGGGLADAFLPKMLAEGTEGSGLSPAMEPLITGMDVSARQAFFQQKGWLKNKPGGAPGAPGDMDLMAGDAGSTITKDLANMRIAANEDARALAAFDNEIVPATTAINSFKEALTNATGPIQALYKGTSANLSETWWDVFYDPLALLGHPQITHPSRPTSTTPADKRKHSP